MAYRTLLMDSFDGNEQLSLNGRAFYLLTESEACF